MTIRTREEVLAHPIIEALNPAGKQFMEVRWLSPALNPHAGRDIKMAALIPFTIFPHIKAVPAFQMLMEDLALGKYEGKHTIVVDSSGNTAHAVARLAPAFGFDEVKIVLSSDVPESKVGILDALSSVEVIKVGKGKSVAARAREEAEKDGFVHLDQYSHMGNMRAHEYFTAPEIERVLGDDIAALAIAMGSSGTAAGVGKYFRRCQPDLEVIGVRPALGEQVPGARDERRMAEVVKIPWSDFVPKVYDISRKASFLGMRKLWSEVEPQPGPTSGLAYQGLLAYLAELEKLDHLDALAGKTVGFCCPDDGRFYSERTTGELDTGQGVG